MLAEQNKTKTHTKVWTEKSATEIILGNWQVAVKQYAPKQPAGESWEKGAIRRQIQKDFGTKDNGNTTYQNQWDAATVVLREKFIATNAYIIKKI